MKNIFLISIVLVLIANSLTYCKKSNDNKGELVGKWKLDSIQLRTVSSGQEIYATIYKPSQDYYDYRSDDKLYRYYNSRYDTVPYQQVIIDGNLYIKYTPTGTDSIKVLTRQSLIFTAPQGGVSKLFFTRK